MDKEIESNAATSQLGVHPPFAEEAQRRVTNCYVRLPSGVRASLASITIGDIVDLHPSLAGAEVLSEPLYKILSGAGELMPDVDAVLQPLAVIRINGKYVCVSSPGDFISMRQMLPSGAAVLAVVIDGVDASVTDQQLRCNADLQTVIAICRAAPLGPRRMIGDLSKHLPAWAKKILGGGRTSLRAMCANLGISVNTTKKMAMPGQDDAVPESYDINTSVERRNEWRRRRHDAE